MMMAATESIILVASLGEEESCGDYCHGGLCWSFLLTTLISGALFLYE